MGIELGDMWVRYRADVSDLASKMGQAKSSMSSANEGAQTAGSGISAAFQKAGSGVEVAAAKLTLINSKVTEARAALQKLQGAANAGEAVTGIPEAQAKLTLLEASAQEARDKLQSLQSAGNETASSVGGGFVSGISSGVSSLMDFANRLGQSVISLQTLGTSAVSAAQSLLGPAASAETMDSAFTTLLGSTKAANDEMQKLDAFASKTPFTTLDIDKAGSELIAFKTNAADVVPELTAIGDELGSVGRGSAANMDSVVNIFGKIRTEGKLTIGTMQELAINGIDSWSALEKSTGKTKDQLTNMISAGLIPANDAVKDLTSGIESNPLYTGGMARQSNTMTGLISTLKSNWDQMLVSFGSPILKGLEPVISNVGTALTSPGFKSFAGSIGQGIVGIFQNLSQVGSKLSPIFQYIGFMFHLMAFNISDFASSQAPAIGALQKFGSLLGSLVSGNIEQFLSMLDTIELLVLSVASGLSSSLSPALQIAGQVFTGVQNAMYPVVNALENKFQPALDNLVQAIAPILSSTLQWIANSGLVSDALSLVGSVVTTVVTDLSGLINGLAQTVNFFQQNQDAAAALIVPIGALGGYFTYLGVTGIVSFIAAAPAMIAGFIAGAGAAWTMAAGVIAATWPFLLIGIAIGGVVALVVLAIQHWSQIVAVLTSAWSAVSGFFTDLWGKVTGTFQKVVGDVTGFVSGLWNTVSNLFQGGVKKVGDTVSGIGNFFKNAGTTATTNAKSGWDNVVGAYQAGNQKLVDAGKWLYDHNYYVKAVVDKIVELFNYAVKIVPVLWSDFTAWIVGEWQLFVATTTSKWTAVATAIHDGFFAAVAFVQAIWSFISTVFVNAWTNYIQKPLTSAWKAVSDAFSSAWKNWIVGPLTSFWQSVSGFFSSAWATYVQKPVGDFWGKFSDNVGKAWSILSNNFNNLWKSISNWFGGLAHDAVQWGINIINGIGNGIQSGIGAIGSTISNIGTNDWHTIGGHAAGGNNLPGGWSVVGEKGPELQYTPAGASILPNDVFQGLMSGQSASPTLSVQNSSSSSGGNITHVHLHFDGQEMASVLIDPLMNRVVKMIRMQGGKMLNI